MSVHNNYKNMTSYKIKSSLIHRQGLYAAYNIKRSSKIIEYKGKKITKHKAETDLKYDEPNNPSLKIVWKKKLTSIRIANKILNFLEKKANYN